MPGIKKQYTLLPLVLAGIVQTAFVFAQQMGWLESAHPYYEVTGLFGNPGQMGGFQAFACVALLQLWVEGGRKRILWWTAVSLLLLYPLSVSCSRSAWLATLIGSAVVLWRPLCRFFSRYRRLVPLFICAMVLSGILMYTLRPASVNGRLLIWRVSADMIADSPWTGLGSGGFARSYMLYQAAFFATHPDSVFAEVAGDVDYPFNDLLRICVEHGLTGGLFTLVMLVTVYMLCQEKRRLGLLATYLVFASFSYPSYKWGLFIVFPLAVLYAVDFSQGTGRTPLALLCTSISLFFFVWHLPEALHPQSHPTCSLWCQRGEQALARGERELAQAYFIEGKFMAPSRTRPQYLLWRLSLQEGKSLQARSIARQMLSRPPKVWDTFTIRARAEVSDWLQDNDGDS